MGWEPTTAAKGKLRCVNVRRSTEKPAYYFRVPPATRRPKKPMTGTSKAGK